MANVVLLHSGLWFSFFCVLFYSIIPVAGVALWCVVCVCLCVCFWLHFLCELMSVLFILLAYFKSGYRLEANREERERNTKRILQPGERKKGRESFSIIEVHFKLSTRVHHCRYCFFTRPHNQTVFCTSPTSKTSSTTSSSSSSCSSAFPPPPNDSQSWAYLSNVSLNKKAFVFTLRSLFSFPPPLFSFLLHSPFLLWANQFTLSSSFFSQGVFKCGFMITVRVSLCVCFSFFLFLSLFRSLSFYHSVCVCL